MLPSKTTVNTREDMTTLPVKSQETAVLSRDSSKPVLFPTSDKGANSSLMDGTVLDPFAWIVLQLPRPLWEKGEDLLKQLQEVIHWNVLTGEISLLHDFESDERKLIKGSNIVDILHHALSPGPLEPLGYRQVSRFLPQGLTRPFSPSPSPPPKKVEIKKVEIKKVKKGKKKVKASKRKQPSASLKWFSLPQ
jgi:hypothetical protein